MSINSPVIKMTQIKPTIKPNYILNITLIKQGSTNVKSKRQTYEDKWGNKGKGKE